MSISRFVPVILVLCASASTAQTIRDIELRRLFEPSSSEIQAEHSGRIFIYEGLRDTDVARALEEQFDRVESMMFIRQQVTDSDGAVKKDPKTDTPVYQDDGC